MSIEVRPLGAADAEVARRMGWEAFGFPAVPPDEPAAVDQPGRTWFGAFEDGQQVGRVIDRVYDSCFGGERLPTCGVAGVTIAAEARGRGVLSPLFVAMLTHARQRGAVISTLFPTAPGIYRRFGYELVADFVTVEVATAALTAARVPTGVRTRRATVGDVEAVRGVYEAWALEQNGPLSRRGVSFPASDEDLRGATTGLSVAEQDDGTIVGYASWNRGHSYGEGAAIEVPELLARTPEGYQALLRLLGSFSSVAPTVRLDTSGDDLARLQLPSLPWRVTSSSPYMLKILDVEGALTALRYPRSVTADLTFTLAGDFLPELDGGYRLQVRDGRASCVRTDPQDRVLTSRGLALAFAGTQSSANLRAAGQLRGGDLEHDLDWDALFGGRQAHIRNYF